MATIGEVKALLSQAIMRSGEGYAALQAIRVNVGEAAEAFKEAAEASGIVSDGTVDEFVNGAVARYYEAESKARAIMQFIDDAQDAAMGANNMAETYMGMLG